MDCDDKTIAFYSVSNDLLRIGANFSREFKSFLKQNISNEILYELLDWDNFPAVKLDMLAVHEDFHRSKIGTVLMESILYNFSTNNKTGCFFVTADALNTKKAISFYEFHEFKFLSKYDSSKKSVMMYRSLL